MARVEGEGGRRVSLAKRLKLYRRRGELVKLRNKYLDSLLWRWHCRKNGPVSEIDAKIDKLDALIHEKLDP